MPNWWDYEPFPTYYARTRQKFEERARQSALNRLMSQALRSRGYLPEVAGLEPTEPLPTPEPEKHSGGGIFGKIKDTLGDVTESVFQGAVDQPWDVLRPVANALEWEREHVAEPVARGAVAGIAAPIISKREDISLSEAFSRGWERYEEVPGVAQEPLELAASPSMWLGGEAIGAGLKGVRAAERFIILEPLFGRAALKAMAGAAGESPSMQKLLEAYRSLGDMDVLGVRSADDVFKAFREKLSFTRAFRARIGRSDRGARILERMGIRAFDDDWAILAAENLRMKAVGASARYSWVSVMKRFAKSSGLNIAEDGRLVDLPGKPFVEDVAAHLSLYPAISPAQRDAIRMIAEPMRTLRQLELAAGVKPSNRPVEVYFHRQGMSKAGVIDVTTGEPLRIPLGPEVGRAYGATQPFQRPVTFASKEAGVKAGMEYEPFWEAQGARIEQGFNRISDNWLNAALEGVGKTPTELVPLNMRNAYQDAANRYAWLRALGREVSRQVQRPARRAFKAPVAHDARAFFRGAKAAPDDVRSLIDRLEDASKLPKIHERHLAYFDIQAEMKPLIEQASATRKMAHSRVRAFRKGITRQATGGTTEFPREFHGRYYPEEIGSRLQEEFARTQIGPIEQAVVNVNNTFRAIVASWDISFLGIQGLLGLATNPKAYFQTMKNATFFGYEDFMAQAYRSGTLTRALRSGVHISSDQVGEFMVGRTITDIPYLGKGFQLSNQWFSRFGNALRLKMFESGLKTGMSRAEMEALGRNVNLATGYSAGKPHRIETIALFAPRFFRAQLGLLGDAAMQPGVAGNRARHQIIALMAEGTVLTMAANALQGRETIMDPRDPNFLRIRAFGRDISLFGPWDTLARGISYIATEGPIEGAAYLSRSKASPALARVYDTIAGETFKGQKIDFRGGPVEIAQSVIALGSQMLPISVQQSFVEQGLPETPGQLAGAFTEFLGTKATPLTGWERLAETRDKYARQEYSQSWDELGPRAHWELEQRFPDELKRPEATTDVGKYLEARKAIGDKYYTYLEELEKQVQSGALTIPEWREQYVEMQKLKAGEYKGLDSASKEAIDKLDQKPGNANEEALQEHSQAFRKATTAWGVIDPERLDKELAKVEAGWTSAQKAYVEENTGYKNTPTLERYRAAQKKLQAYWDVEEQVWDQFRSQYRDLAPYETADDYAHALQQQLIGLGMPSDQAAFQIQQSRILKAFEKMKAGKRRVLRAQNPEIDQLLFEFYGYTPLRFQQPSSGAATKSLRQTSLRSVSLRR